MKRKFHWIWFVGAAVWFFNAARDLHRHSLMWGLLDTVVSAMFLAVGMILKKQGS